MPIVATRKPSPFHEIFSHIKSLNRKQLRRFRTSNRSQGALPSGDRFARDIGLSSTEQALHELRLPSQSWHHRGF